MKTILVPTDFSETALRALRTAVRIARKSKSEILLLHVIPSVQSHSALGGAGQWDGNEAAEGEVPFMIKVLKSTKAKMKKIIRDASLPGVRITDTIEKGSVSDSILHSARRNKAWMIVMGTHGAKGLNEIFVGSNAAHVVRDSEVPVLTVRNGEPEKLDTILFATDFSADTGLAVPFLKGFAKDLGAEIKLVKVLSAGDTEEVKHALQSGRQFVKDYGLTGAAPVVLHNINTKEEGILRQAKAEEADLIAIGTHGRHGLARFFAGSIAEEMVNHASLPVLTINFHRVLEETRSRAGHEEERRARRSKKPLQGYSGHTPLI